MRVTIPHAVTKLNHSLRYRVTRPSEASSATYPHAYEIRSVDLALYFARLHAVGVGTAGASTGLKLEGNEPPAARADATETR
jgi:hypothetical protein